VQLRFAVDAHDMVAAVVAVAGRAAAAVAGPCQIDAIGMLVVHGFDASCLALRSAARRTIPLASRCSCIGAHDAARRISRKYRGMYMTIPYASFPVSARVSSDVITAFC